VAVAELLSDSMAHDLQLMGSSPDQVLVFMLLVKATWVLQPLLAEAQQRALASGGEQGGI
jgi:hypothetical protein